MTTGITKYSKAEREQIKTTALDKMTAYCRSTPRSHQEIKNRLYTMGLWKREVEEILSKLIEEGHASEERFAAHLVEEKIRGWGKMKIRQYLAQQQVSEYNIKYVLKKVDDEAYKNKLYELAQQKWNSIWGLDVNTFIKRKKTIAYLLQKGYEYKLICQALEGLK